jgi:dipeptidyl aminopeptidase/acylaminoacyl peptidase
MTTLSEYIKNVCVLVTAVIVGLVSCPASGQVLPKILTKEDYHNWHSLTLEPASSTGGWACFKKSYESGKDTLFIKNAFSSVELQFPNAIDPKFGAAHTFGCITADTLLLTSLNGYKHISVQSVVQYDFSATAGHLVVATKSKDSLHQLTIYNPALAVVKTISGVVSYQWNVQKTALAYIHSNGQKYAASILYLNRKITIQNIATCIDHPLSTLKWNSTGSAIAFFGLPDGRSQLGDIVYCYNKSRHRLSVIGPLPISASGAIKISSSQDVQLSVSDDGQRVFFGRSLPANVDHSLLSNTTEIWYHNDTVLYPSRKMIAENGGDKQLLAMWDINSNTLLPITDQSQTWAMLCGRQRHALIADPVAYEPQYSWFANMDYYLVDLHTGIKSLLLKNQIGLDGAVKSSLDGKFITYYSGSDWWIYDVMNEEHRNLTKGLAGEWDNRKSDPAEELKYWGNAGWSADYKFALYYDYYDIWAISPDAKTRRRLTKGRERNIRFRCEPSAGSTSGTIYSATLSTAFDINKDLLLTAVNLYEGSSGYYLLDFAKGERPLVYGDAEISGIKYGKDGGSFYLQQTFNQSPAINFLPANNAASTTIARSNEQQQNFQWGHSKMIHYDKPQGGTLNGALFYPAGYQQGKKYPMIVYIYSIVSGALHQYVNPSLQNSIGFNVANLTAQGYLVYMPDIAYGVGTTGFSAASCVTAAVEKVISMGVVDPGKIGLFGHSFGGYETNFILTQTNLFAAAVSGSSVSDNISHYFTINENNNKPEAWRYENQQYRMRKSFFDDPQMYYANSPLTHAANITTPLLLWAGAKDVNVQPRQSTTFYLALRRLRKKAIMLVYPNDSHILSEKDNQIDLTTRTEEWFGHFLKDEPKPSWD